MASSTFGLIVPHPPIFVPSVGGDGRRKAQASLDALETARRALDAYDPETLIVMSPHAPAVYDTFLVDTSERMSGSLEEFGDPTSYSWEVDTQLAEAILSAVDIADIPIAPREADERLRGGWLDHASIVPLSFLDPEAHRRVVVLSLSFLALASHRIVGRLVRECAQDLGRRVAFVASGDCSHRLTVQAPAGFSERGKEFDERLVRIVAAGQLEELVQTDPKLAEEAGECGLRSFVTLGGFSGDDPVPTRVLAYEGPWGVGYLTALVGQDAVSAAPTAEEDAHVEVPYEPRDPESEIVALARGTIAWRLGRGEQPTAILTSSDYPAAAGAFVSLHREGALRGCIGTVAPVQPTLALEVQHNALEAALHDPRFSVMTEDELDDLEISVDVLHPPEPARVEDLDPKQFGVIVTAGQRRGLLLPDLEGVDDVDTQLEIALGKGDISASEPYRIERFRVERFH